MRPVPEGEGVCGGGELVMQYESNEKEINTPCGVKHVTPPLPPVLLLHIIAVFVIGWHAVRRRARTHTHTKVRAGNPLP